MFTQRKLITSFNIQKEEWNQKKNILKKMYPELTDKDLEYKQGQSQELIDRIHSIIGQTTGKSKVGLVEFIDKLE